MLRRPIGFASREIDCWDNAVAESFFSSLKWEVEGLGNCESRDLARMLVSQYIDGFYNLQRRHSTLGYLSPVEFELVYSMKAAAEPNHPSNRVNLRLSLRRLSRRVSQSRRSRPSPLRLLAQERAWGERGPLILFPDLGHLQRLHQHRRSNHRHVLSAVHEVGRRGVVPEPDDVL